MLGSHQGLTVQADFALKEGQPPTGTDHARHNLHPSAAGNRPYVRDVERSRQAARLPIARARDGHERGGGAYIQQQGGSAAMKVADAVAILGWYRERECGGAISGRRVEMQVLGQQVCVEALERRVSVQAEKERGGSVHGRRRRAQSR